MEAPIIVPWGIRISKDDVEKLRAGFASKQMQQRWDIKSEETDGVLTVRILRSWTNKLCLVMKVVINEDGDAEVTDFTWESRSGGDTFTEDECKKLAVRLCRGWCDCEFGEFEF
ncbi:hypothetical protein KVT40_003311 [Elsinoe batatas]|uniref:Uncharacterized protein n=1 Tax=Elsinoe batatas TaxID=2601811 RepID=A0A8K0PGY0_9PEZI|nr:hypothetical protein KVT40_003311 [Elsinoe batatas]